jgi:hypothetical protein
MSVKTKIVFNQKILLFAKLKKVLGLNIPNIFGLFFTTSLGKIEAYLTEIREIGDQNNSVRY